MICSTTRLTLILAVVGLVACAKKGITQDPVASLDYPSLTQSYSSDLFFPYQQPVDTFTQPALISNPNDAARFHLSYAPRDPNPNLKVTVNGVLTTAGVSLDNQNLVIQPQPPPSAQVVVSYDVQNPNDVMRTQLVLIPVSVDLQTLRVALNQNVVSFNALHLAVDSTGEYYVFDPSMVLFNYDDPYQVYALKGLDVFISGTLVITGSQ
jgi:hypothetical protein